MKTKEIISAIRRERGNVTAAAASLGISRAGLYIKINRQPTLRQAIDEARESMLDSAEHVLHQKVEAGEAWAVCFYLKTQGKSRGYQETPLVQVNTATIVNQNLSVLSDEQLQVAYSIAELIEKGSGAEE